MSYDAQITRHGAMALFDLKGAAADFAGYELPPFPDQPNHKTTRDDVDLLHIGRDHWLVMAPFDQEQSLEQVLNPTQAPADISIVRISDTQCFFAITGPDADQIMSIASPLDIHASAFAENAATFTEAFGLKALITRQPGGYWLAVEQSFGDMVEDYLTRVMS